MKTNVASTSVERYKQLVAEGTVNHQQARILSKMEPGREYTRKELARITLLEPGTVSGRVNELVNGDLKLLTEGAKRKCQVSGSTVGTVRLVEAG